MSFKDHYKTLGVSPDTTAADIKKAFRKLAHQYHPDKAASNPYAEVFFREIHAAYAVLSDQKARQLYDEERYFSGLSFTKQPVAVSSEWLLQQAEQLSRHMEQLDSYHINHKALHDHVMMFFGDEHLAVLMRENKKELQVQIVQQILEAIKRIDPRYAQSLADRMLSVAGGDGSIEMLIAEFVRKRKAKRFLDRYGLLFVVLVAILLCLLMWLYASR